MQAHKSGHRYFNPRSREGSDASKISLFSSTAISIHAPAKGATMRFTRNHPAHQSFQSTLPRRERPAVCSRHPGGVKFQSTLLRRERRDYLVFLEDFNPRSREGSDAHGCDACCAVIISIHAPAKGATTHGIVLAVNKDISIHAPAKGATCGCALTESEYRLFQSTLPRRERLYRRAIASGDFIFQSTLPRRERPPQSWCYVEKWEFQSTLPRRERQPS